MQSLIARLEKAEAGSRELDAEIDRAIILPKQVARSRILEWWCDGENWSCNTEDGYRHLNWMPIGKWSQSIDAALTLVPKKCRIDHIQQSDNGMWWDAGVSECDKSELCGQTESGAPTPALALCIAALRARAAGDVVER